MKVGLFTTNQHFLETDMVKALDEQIAMVHVARDNNWDSLFSGQHYLNEGNNKQLQLVPFLTRLIPEAGDMTTGLGVMLINLHNPVYIAETVATLDIIARGNFVFGVGLGYRDVEFDAFNVPKGSRVKRFEEYLELVQRLWSEESVSHHSDTCILDNVRMNIRPVQQPRPPIWFAANNDKAIRRAARMGDNWFINPHSTLDTIRRQMLIYRDELKTHARNFPGSSLSSKRFSARRTVPPPPSWPGLIYWESTGTTPSGGRTMPCPMTSPSTRTSRNSPGVASCWDRRKNATSSYNRTGRNSASIT